MSDLESQSSTSAKIGSPEISNASAPIEWVPPGPGLSVRRRTKKSSPAPVLIGIFGALVVSVGALVVLTQKTLNKPKTPVDSDDLGAGISNASGLRGHLVTRWQGKTQYMLKIEPLDPRDASGFAAVASNPPGPISINVRLLDSSGFALCGKEILMPYNPGRISRASSLLRKNNGPSEADLDRAAIVEKAREGGKDVFQNILGSDGTVEALWAQGELPCSPDQYRRFDYWDLSTNFPTRAEQNQLLGRRPGGSTDADADRAQRESMDALRRKALPKLQSAFYMEGDDRATAFEPGRNLLTIGPGKTFTVVRAADVITAAAWADDSSLIHYTCDQHAACALKRAGSTAAIPAKMD
jgi:hypothetical protein